MFIVYPFERFRNAVFLTVHKRLVLLLDTFNRLLLKSFLQIKPNIKYVLRSKILFTYLFILLLFDVFGLLKSSTFLLLLLFQPCFSNCNLFFVGFLNQFVIKHFSVEQALFNFDQFQKVSFIEKN